MKMKVTIKKMNDDAESSVLDELIGKAESAMASPFKKAKAVEVPQDDAEESSESDAEKKKEVTDGSGLSEEDLKKLLELYNQMKD